jgi:hypothetical protein
MSGQACNAILLFVLPCGAGMTGTHHHAQPLVQVGGSHELFARAVLEL